MTMNEVCGDNRFEVISKAKEHILKSTNIDASKDEMKCLDSFLFRCWQMGWLKQYDSNSENPNKSFDGMTNGEVIKALFPYIEAETYEYTTSVKWLDCDKDAEDPYSYFWSKWWNAPYKAERG